MDQWNATALQGEMGRFACLLSMVFFALAGLIVRLVGLFRALRSRRDARSTWKSARKVAAGMCSMESLAGYPPQLRQDGER